MGPYRRLVTRRIRATFAAVGAQDARTVLAGLAPDVHHVFAGDHALAGERHDAAAVARWFARLGRLFPGLRFHIARVAVSGPPWRTVVAVEWVAAVTPQRGPAYENRGAHVIAIRWGRVVELHAYEDSEAVAAACRRMVELGVAEAGAPPVTSRSR